MDMSDNTAPAEGGKKIIILCEKVSKEDIKVRFFDYNGWEEWADFGPAGVHKQYAISLTAPRYSDPGITEAVRVGVELVKPSDDSRSEEEEFFYLPSSRPGPAPAPPQPAPVKRETVLRNLDTQPKNVYSGGGYVTEVKREGGGGAGETWQQMTSGLAPAKPRPQDPYSKVVLTEGNNLGLSSYTFEYNIPVTQGAGAGGEFGLQQYSLSQSPYSETQSPYSNMSQPSPDSSGLANLNIAGSSPMAQPPNVSDSDIVNILGLQDPPTDSDMHNLSDKLGEFSLGGGGPPASSAPAQARAAPKRSSRQAENDSASQLIPRQMERQQSSITTPNVTSELSDILNNCKQINDL